VRNSPAVLVAALLLVVSSGCHRGQVRIQVAPGVDRRVWREPLQPEQYRAPARRLLYTAEPPVGYAEARHMPGQSLAVALRLNWNAAVRPLADSFDQLRKRHNAADITLREFASRQDELLAVLVDLADLKRQLDDLLAEYEANLPTADSPSADGGLMTKAVRARAKQINERAAERVARVRPPEGAAEAPESPAEGRASP